jgi:hypothetical protein
MNANTLRVKAILCFAYLLLHASHLAAEDNQRFLIEAYPSDVLASKQLYQRHIAASGATVDNIPFYLIVPRLQRWVPGQTVRVAFNGGNSSLYEKISSVANRWITEAGINLRFSFTDAEGEYRAWTPDDADYAAEIRIAFYSDSRGGYWSHVGTDSVNANLVGGLPGHASMNLEGFDKKLPTTWAATVLHEFGHALGFEHEHQSPAGGCDFRFEDDPGYQFTTDEQGWPWKDEAGRRPGLYTYLGGHPNRWTSDMVDSNLKVLPVSSAFLMSDFDKDSIMKYQFPDFFFRAGDQSSCYTPIENEHLSKGDIKGAKRAYSSDAAAVATLITQRRVLLSELRNAAGSSDGLKAHASTQLKAMDF